MSEPSEHLAELLALLREVKQRSALRVSEDESGELSEPGRCSGQSVDRQLRQWVAAAAVSDSCING